MMNLLIKLSVLLFVILNYMQVAAQQRTTFNSGDSSSNLSTVTSPVSVESTESGNETIPADALTTIENSTLNSLLKAFSENPVLQKLLDVVIPSNVTKTAFMNLDRPFLKKCGQSFPKEVANLIDEAAGAGDLKLTDYFKAVINAILEFLVSYGTPIEPKMFQSYASSVEKSLESTNVNNIEEVFKLLFEAYISFISSLGIDFCKNINDITIEFAKEICLQKKSEH